MMMKDSENDHLIVHLLPIVDFLNFWSWLYISNGDIRSLPWKIQFYLNGQIKIPYVHT